MLRLLNRRVGHLAESPGEDAMKNRIGRARDYRGAGRATNGPFGAATAPPRQLATLCASLLLLTLTLPVESAAVIRPEICAGDCNHDRTTAVDELVSGVGIALGSMQIGRCPVLDLSGDGRANIDELVAAVHSAIEGCPAPPFEPTKCRFRCRRT